MRSGALAALGRERRAGPGPARPSAGGGAAEKPLSAGAGVWAERRGSSAGPRKAAGPPRSGVPEAGRGSPERNPPREGSEGCGREGGGRPTRPQLAARRCDANWRPFRRCPRSGLSELSASARGETGVCLFRSGRKKKPSKPMGLPMPSGAGLLFPTEKRRALRKQESAAPAFPAPHVLPPPRSRGAPRGAREPPGGGRARAVREPRAPLRRCGRAMAQHSRPRAARPGLGSLSG